jgi:flagellar hook-length control protein FliK
MIHIQHIEKLEFHSPTPKDQEKSIHNGEDHFSPILNQFLNPEKEEKISHAVSNQKKETGKNKTEGIENKRVKEKETSVFQRKKPRKSSRAGYIRGMIVRKGKLTQKIKNGDMLLAKKKPLTEKKPLEEKGNAFRPSANRARKIVLQKYILARGIKGKSEKRTNGKVTLFNGNDRKKTVSHNAWNTDKAPIRMEKEKLTFKAGKKAFASDIKNGMHENIYKNEGQLRVSSQNSEITPADKEFPLALVRYENNVPKMHMKQDYQISKTADEVFNDIVSKFTLIVRKGGGEAHLILQPEVLGKVKLDLKLNQQRVSSVIIVENQSVKDLIISKLNILEQNLLQNGFSLGSFQVEVKDKNTGLNPSGQGASKRVLVENSTENEQEAISSPLLSLPWISTIVNVTA